MNRVSRATEKEDTWDRSYTDMPTLGEADVRRTKEEEDTRRLSVSARWCNKSRTERVTDSPGREGEVDLARELERVPTGGNMCAWRGRRGSTAELDFSDSEFCSSFFLRPPFPFRALSTTLSVSIPPSPSHHRFTLSRRYRRRAPRFPWRTIHSSAPVLFSATTTTATTTIAITTPTPTTTTITIVLLYLYIRMVSFFLLYCPLTRSPSGPLAPARSARPRRPNRWCCRHNKTWKKRWPTYTRTDVHRERKSTTEPATVRSCIRLPSGSDRRREKEKSRRSTVLRGYS